jgi:hypothetical protein
MADMQPGWYDDGSGTMRWWDGRAWTNNVQPRGAAPAAQHHPAQGARYVVLQVGLKEAFMGTHSGNLVELEQAINAQAALGYRLHTITTASSGSSGFGGGDRIQATMVFERLT